LVLLPHPVVSGAQDVQWKKLFYSDFEAEGVLDPPEGGSLNAQDWRWYPEGLTGTYLWEKQNWHCIQVTTEVSHSGRRALEFYALPQVPGITEGVRCSMALGSGKEEYWSHPTKEYLQYYLYILPEFYDFVRGTEPGSHGIFIDIEIFDGSYNRAGLIYFDVWGNMARMAEFAHTPTGSQARREIIARNQFTLEPATWYKVRLEVDHGNNKIIRFSLEGPGVSYSRDMSYEIPSAKQLEARFKALFYDVGAQVPAEQGYAYKPMVIIDDVEGGIEAVPPVTSETATTVTVTTPPTTPTTAATTTATLTTTTVTPVTTTATPTTTTVMPVTTIPTTTTTETVVGMAHLMRWALLLLLIAVVVVLVIAILLRRRGG